MKCSQDGCEAPATMTVFWPGQTRDMCDEHARRAVSIAEIMGFDVDARPVAPEVEQ